MRVRSITDSITVRSRGFLRHCFRSYWIGHTDTTKRVRYESHVVGSIALGINNPVPDIVLFGGNLLRGSTDIIQLRVKW
jgi:hypothetical protein